MSTGPGSDGPLGHYKDKLVVLYASHDIASVKADGSILAGAFGRPVQELAGERQFSLDQEFVENLKAPIESRIQEFETADVRAQVARCLRMLLQLAMFDNSDRSTFELRMKTLRMLFLEMFAALWSVPQRRHFDFVYERLKEWTSYFLSYTNDGANIVNSQYKKVLNLYVDKETLAKRSWDADNLLADAMVNRLRKRLLRLSFYDKANIHVGDDLYLKIGPACGKTFAFVQVVQLETFDTTRSRNWCFEEYQIFRRCNEEDVTADQEYQKVFRKRFNAIVTGKEHEVCPPLLPLGYESWKNRIFREQRFALLPSDPDGFDQTMRELADEIVNLKHQIIDEVPA